MIKLVIFDLDNTLAPVGKGTPQEVVERLRKIAESGVRIAVCSGKPTFYSCGFVRQMEIQNPILIGENGAVIQFGIDLPPVKYEIQFYSQEAKETLRFLRGKIEELLPDVWFQPNEVGLTPFLTKAEEFEVIRNCLQEYSEYINDVIVYEHPDCFDITPNGITKKSGIARLANILKVRPEEMIAVGDGINDYPMFEFAGMSLGIRVKEEDKVDKNFDSIIEALEYIQELLIQ